jgi:hypothetical protein
MARFYCNQPELPELAARGSFITSGSMTRDASPLTFPARQEIMAEPGVRNPRVPVYALTKSREFNKSIAEVAATVEKETAELVAHLNDEVVPAVRQHSTKALRIAAEKLANLADYMEKNQPPRK